MVNLKQLKQWLMAMLVFFWSSTSVFAGTISYDVCLESSLSIKPDGVWIPVGCELSNCYPSNSVSPIDLHIRLSGLPAESAILRFENLPATSNLSVTGNGEWLPEAQPSLRVRKGVTVLSGFVVSPHQSIVPGATLQINLNGQGLTQTTIVEFEVQQLIGNVPVNDFKLDYNCLRCPSPSGPAGSDSININQNLGGDEAVLLLKGLDKPSCFSDRFFWGLSVVHPGNIVPSCNTEIIVFSNDNAMKLVEAPAWSNTGGDSIDINLSPISRVPVNVWLAPGVNESKARILAATANLLFNSDSNKCGIAFDATYRLGPSIPVVNYSQVTSLACEGALSQTTQMSFFTPNQLNVYFIDVPFTGVMCGNNSKVVIIGTLANSQALAHEFGHSFSLGHVTDNKFGSRNIMIGDKNERDYFTAGQTFMMNVKSSSTLNQVFQNDGSKVRTGPIRDCGTSSIPPCPDIWKKIPLK